MLKTQTCMKKATELILEVLSVIAQIFNNTVVDCKKIKKTIIIINIRYHNIINVINERWH